MRLSSNITVRTDRAPALQALAKSNDDLSNIGINLQLPNDAFNKNANCHVDKIIQELETELKKISPLGRQITHAELARATLSLNSKIRQSSVTASEAQFSRDSAMLQPICQQQIKLTKHRPPETGPEVSAGDTVFIKHQTSYSSTFSGDIQGRRPDFCQEDPPHRPQLLPPSQTIPCAANDNSVICLQNPPSYLPDTPSPQT